MSTCSVKYFVDNIPDRDTFGDKLYCVMYSEAASLNCFERPNQLQRKFPSTAADCLLRTATVREDIAISTTSHVIP